MADIVEVILKGACVGQAVYNVLHMKDNADLGPVVLVEAMEAGGAASWINELVDCLCSDYTIASILTRASIDTVAGPQLETPFSVPYTGQIGATASALTMCGVIKWVTALGGRSGRGRSYIGPLATNQVEDGTIIAGSLAALEGFKDSMLSVFNALGADYNGNFELGIWSKVLPAFNEVTGGVVRTASKTQRRRQLGVGI